MNRERSKTRRSLIAAVAWLGLAAPGALYADAPALRPDFERQATWTIPTPAEIQAKALSWLAECGAATERVVQAEALWTPGDAADPLERLAATFALGDPRAEKLVLEVRRAHVPGAALPDASWLTAADTPAFERDNLRVFYGRWLAQQALYDEALPQLAELKPAAVVDPATLLFYQAAAHHQLLDRDAALLEIETLLERRAEIPRRYESLARLMQADLKPLEDDSLDHIARRMDDIRRRLDLGRGGPKVREVENGVVASLDKLIDKLEQQEQENNQSQSQQQAPPRPPKAGEKIAPTPIKGPGKVTQKDIGHKSGWGDLPPKERQEALQQIGQNFPAHYREMIEQYFRKLATEPEEK